MKIPFATAAAVLTLAFATTALADSQVTATLESPIAGKTQFIAAHAVFNCEATSCVAAVAPDDALGLDGCKEVAHKVGRLSAYGDYKPLDAKALAKCNTAAPAAKTALATNAH